MDPVVVRIDKDTLMGRRGYHAPAARRVFVAYRMQLSVSVQMRNSLSDELNHRDIECLDGELEGGEHWAPEIRSRINKSKLLVADLTGPGREVLFEMGFASTLPLLPVVRTPQDFEEVPAWLSTTQGMIYEKAGIPRIARRIHQLLASDSLGRRKIPAPLPGRIVWVHDRRSEWSFEVLQKAKLLARELGHDILVLDPDQLESPEDIGEAMSAWLLIAVIDGYESDYLAHYLVGDVAGRRMAGQGRRKGESLSRSSIILTNTSADNENVAASIRQLPKDTVVMSTVGQLIPILKGKFKSLDRWLDGSGPK